MIQVFLSFSLHIKINDNQDGKKFHVWKKEEKICKRHKCYAKLKTNDATVLLISIENNII